MTFQSFKKPINVAHSEHNKQCIGWQFDMNVQFLRRHKLKVRTHLNFWTIKTRLTPKKSKLNNTKPRFSKSDLKNIDKQYLLP